VTTLASYSPLGHPSTQKEIKFKKKLSEVQLPVKTATHKSNYVLCILHFSATSFLVNFFKGLALLQLAMVEC